MRYLNGFDSILRRMMGKGGGGWVGGRGEGEGYTDGLKFDSIICLHMLSFL